MTTSATPPRTSALDFNEFVELALRAPGREKMRPVVEKELLHYDILSAFDRAGLLKNLVFQGGTSLRLCRGSNRFSEDLDFAGGKNFNAIEFEKLKTAVERHLTERYGESIQVYVTPPSNSNFEHVKVDKWQVSVHTSPKRRDIARQRIKIEVANIPAYTREPLMLRQNYAFLHGYGNFLINTERVEEVMADKLVAYPSAEHIRHRDLWDFGWLAQQGAVPNSDLVTKKLADYGVPLDTYLERLRSTREQLKEVIHGKDFFDQMSRFIEADALVRTLAQPAFLGYLEGVVNGLFAKVQADLATQEDDDKPSAGKTFRM